ncbi:hypothetical protein ATCCBAA256_11280 [Mycobacterium montefiorense]|nr:hypothetical protein [Mycobacterium montefiorense]GLE51545.1 hypothetical protein ATCCBAA256_11280 [Mycobacterium montefiorense]
MRNDRRHKEVTVAVQRDLRSPRRDPARRVDCGMFVTAGGQPGGFAGGIDTADLH